MTLTPRRAVVTLGVSQTIGYAGSSYLPATLAAPMAASLHMPTSSVFLAFSVALLLQAVIGPRLGRLVDQRGGRSPLVGASLTFAVGLFALSLAQTPWQLTLGRLIVGLAMGAGLYDIAFAGLVGWFGTEARRSITGVTLIAGFASTIGWPLTTWIEHHWGWRIACVAWALANLLIALPLHLSLPKGRVEPVIAPQVPSTGEVAIADQRAMVILALAFAVQAGIGSAMSAHLPPLLQAVGASLAVAIAASALVGPAQVAARAMEFFLVRKIHPLISGRVSIALFPIGAGLLILMGEAAAAPFALLYGAGNGLFTIVRGTLPLALFGEKNYGHRLGVINIPSRIVQAAAPFGVTLLMDRSASSALEVLASGSLFALVLLLILKAPRPIQ